MQLKDLTIKSSYRKISDDIAEDFYIPCMKASSRYDRISGYFGSTIYIVAWKGLKSFVSNNHGVMRIICSPYLSQEDYFGSYVETYIERDIRDLISIKNENKFLRFISCVAARTSQEVNLADIAKDAGILTVGVVTKPFKFEGKRRMDQANAGIRELLGKVESLLIIPNDRLKYATDQKVTLANAFEIADDVLRQAVTSISDLIKNTGFINLDFADVTCIMQDAGYAHMGVGHAAGKGKAEEAARIAVASPLMETSINGAHGVLINITGSSDMGLEDVEAAADLVQEAAHPDANIIFGASFDETMQDEIRVTVIATGFEEGAAEAAAAEKAAAEKHAAAQVQEPIVPVAQPAPAAAGGPSVPPVFPVAPVAKPAPSTPEEKADKPAEDPFDNIFKIFNTK